MSNAETIPNNQMTKGNPVMLSDAKHLKLFSHRDVTKAKDQRFFASLRMTVLRLFGSSFVRHSCFVIFLALSVTPLFAEKRPITEKDLWDFQWIGDPQVSPDGSHVAFVRITVNEKKDNYDTALWTVSTAGSEAPVRLTTGKRDSQPRWSPDGKWIAFVRGSAEPPKDGKPQAAQLALLSLSGGEAWVITDLPHGANNPVWSPD